MKFIPKDEHFHFDNEEEVSHVTDIFFNANIMRKT